MCEALDEVCEADAEQAALYPMAAGQQDDGPHGGPADSDATSVIAARANELIKAGLAEEFAGYLQVVNPDAEIPRALYDLENDPYELENVASVPANSEVKAALLFSGLYAGGPTTILEPLVSSDHSERLLEAVRVVAGSTTLLDAPVQAVGGSVVVDLAATPVQP